MIQTFNNIFELNHLQYLLNLPEVLEAKERIDQKSKGSEYFTIDIPSDIQERLKLVFNLNLTKVPMRWIKGDTPPHIDKGVEDFENTYLIYLTDSTGSLVLDDKIYPITQNTGYIFPEGLSHETKDTGNLPRLLLGPMSEKGFAVGSSISRPGGTTIYFRQTTDLEFSFNNADPWTPIGNNYPIVITNNNTSLGVLKIVFVSNITLNESLPGGINKYFVCGSSHLQFGSESLNNDGTRPKITIDDVSSYPGFIQNGSSGGNGFSNIYIYNLEILSINNSSLSDEAGWLCQVYFGRGVDNNYIINCFSDGEIGESCGGIIGANAGNDAGAELTIIGCSSSGNMVSSFAGGIVGQLAAVSGTVICRSCWSEGDQNFSLAGGIFGINAGDSGGTAQAIDCYSTGAIVSGGGGIFGGSAGNGLGSVALAQNCYSTGNIGTDAGGIFGQFAGSNSGTGNATNCYSAGSITTSGNGIYGTGKASGTETNCYPAAATGGWNDTTANSNLTGNPSPVIGTVWVSTGINSPYELLNMGYSPFTINNINTISQNLVTTFSQTITAGNTTSAAIIPGKSYTLLESNPGISINSATGVISTTSGTSAGLYTLYIRNTGSYNITTFNLNLNPFVICFEENSKILIIKNGKETYVPIKHLKKGDLVKTYRSGYKPIEMIGKSVIYNDGSPERVPEKLYLLKKEKYPELREDLMITGFHSILVDHLTPVEREKTLELMNRIYVTDGKYRLIACLDERTIPYPEQGEYNIYHLALENENYYSNYGIYANGLLVETCSRRFLKELSQMMLL